MKYVIILLLAALLWKPPFSGSDVGKLQPVEVLCIRSCDEGIRVDTDTGDFGIGLTPEEALEDMKRKAPGDIFLETADYLVVAPEHITAIAHVMPHLRPGCGVCVELGFGKPDEMAKFFAAHPIPLSLQDYRAGKGPLPIIIVDKESMSFVQSDS